LARFRGGVPESDLPRRRPAGARVMAHLAPIATPAALLALLAGLRLVTIR
jgi:hypothetical protein